MRGVSLGIGYRHQLVAQLSRPALGRAQRSVLILTFVVFGASIHVLLAVPQHGIDEPGQLMCRGGDGLGRTQLGLLPPQERAQGAVGAVQCQGRRPDAMPPRPDWRWAWSLRS